MIDTTTYKAELEQQLAEVTAELRSVGVHTKGNPSDWVAIPEGGDTNEADTDLIADAVEESDERQAIVADLEGRYNDIIRALKKIADGTFGTCEISGEPIELDRLAANPAARTCKSHMNDASTLPL